MAPETIISFYSITEVVEPLSATAQSATHQNATGQTTSESPRTALRTTQLVLVSVLRYDLTDRRDTAIDTTLVELVSELSHDVPWQDDSARNAAALLGGVVS